MSDNTKNTVKLEKVEKKEHNEAEIVFTIDAASFESEVNKVYREKVHKINVPGFRPGKAPRNIIEKMYGKGIFFEDALNRILPSTYHDALEQSGLEVVGSPEFDIEKLDDNGVTIIAKVSTKPVVSISDYKGIEVTRTVKEATDEEVEAEIKRVQERNSRLIEITDRPAQMEDTVNIDFEGFIGDVAFEGGKGTGYTLKLGSGQFIPGFEEQIAGKNIGEEFDVNVTFPAEYHAEELAGKAAVFKTKLNEIKFSELPALDDEFAKDVSEFDTLDEYKASVKAKIQEKNDKETESQVEEQLISTLIEKLDAEIPPVMFEIETENFVRDYDTRLRMQGLDLKTFFQYTGQTLDSLREQFRPQAERQVKTRLALEKIVELENIVATDEEVEKEIESLASYYNMSTEEVKRAVAESDVNKDIQVRKAVEFVKSNAVIK